MSARPRATGTPIEDNPRVTITEWRFTPGAETGWHRHDLDYVVVYLTDADLMVETSDGVATAHMAGGKSYFRKAGTEHNVINSGSAELVFLEVELKWPAP